MLLIVAELIIRTFLPQPIFKHDNQLEYVPPIFAQSDYLPWQLKANSSALHYAITDEFIVNVTINSAGYRDQDFKIKKLRNTKRIIFLGDSYVFGFGVELNETFHQIIKRKLSEKNKSYEIINAGYKGNFAEDTEYLYLKKEGIKLNPDVVLLAITLSNDFDDINTNKLYYNSSDNLYKAESLVHYIDNQSRLRFKQSQESQNFIKRALYKINLVLSYKSHLYILLKDTFRNILYTFYYGKYQNVYSNNYTEEINSSFAKVMNYTIKINELAKKNKAILVLILIPDKRAVYEYKIKDTNSDILNWTKPSEEIKRIAEKNNITVIDVLPDLKDYVNTHNQEMIYFKVDPHWNSKGHKIAAEAIYSKLKSLKIIN